MFGMRTSDACYWSSRLELPVSSIAPERAIERVPKFYFSPFIIACDGSFQMTHLSGSFALQFNGLNGKSDLPNLAERILQHLAIRWSAFALQSLQAAKCSQAVNYNKTASEHIFR